MDALLDKACEEAKQKGLILLIKQSVLTLGQEDLLRKHGFT
jgi:hypothetical protein